MHWIFYRYFTFFPKPLVVRDMGGFKKSSYSFLPHMLPASHSVMVWCDSASPRPGVMTHHTLALSSARFPWPQPRRHSLPGVGQKSVLLTRRGRQLAGGGSLRLHSAWSGHQGLLCLCCSSKLLRSFHQLDLLGDPGWVKLGGCLMRFASKSSYRQINKRKNHTCKPQAQKGTQVKK